MLRVIMTKINLSTVSPFHCSTGKTDYHIHSDFSADSRIKLAELLPHAINLGYKAIAITEHLDLLPQEVSIFGIPPLLKYQARLLQLRNQFPQIAIVFGIEVGDYQKVKDYANILLQSVKFDLVLGSVHFVDNHINVAIPLKEPLSKAQVTEYYEQNLLLVETCDINVLAHLGVYKRFYQTAPNETHVLHLIKKIFEVIVNKGIALELNYSAYRRVFHTLHPDPKYLELYKSLGGRLVTIGSDSHKLDQFDDYYHIAVAAIDKYGFKYLTLSP